MPLRAVHHFRLEEYGDEAALEMIGRNALASSASFQTHIGKTGVHLAARLVRRNALASSASFQTFYPPDKATDRRLGRNALARVGGVK